MKIYILLAISGRETFVESAHMNRDEAKQAFYAADFAPDLDYKMPEFDKYKLLEVDEETQQIVEKAHKVATWNPKTEVLDIKVFDDGIDH